MLKKLTFFLFALPVFLFAQAIQVSSPGDVLQVNFSLENGEPRYSISRLGGEVIRPSRLGFKFRNAPEMTGNFQIAASKQTSFDETWTQPWGEKKDIRNNYNALRVELQENAAPSRQLIIEFRVFDDGVGFRYEIPDQPNFNSFEVSDEVTEFALTGDHDAWWIPAYQWNRYEYLYHHTPVSQMDTVHTPVTMETADGLYLSFHEAALFDYASMTLAVKNDNVLEADLVPWSDGVKVKSDAPMRSPWRTIQVADTPGGLITSYLILNLNEPNKLADISWIKPGKYVGIWWEMHLDVSSWSSGDKHGATTANTMRYIDFAAKNGFSGVLVEGWNVGWDGDWVANCDKFLFTQPYPDFDINALSAYAQKNGVRLIGHHETGGGILNYEKQLSDAYKYYQKLGVRAVKTGYVRHGREIERRDENGTVQKEWHHGQFMVRHYQKTVEEAAKHQIMLNIHEPIKDTGIRRTYPNLLSREGARGQEFNAWGGEGGNPPDHVVILPFTRLLSGPMDYTPGIFDLLFEEARPNNRINGTLMQQLALYVVFYSPLQMAADLPQNYDARPDAFQFIKDVPCDWEDTQVLNARIGDYITTVRKDRNSEDWYLGSITDENGRLLTANLSFLDPAKKYVAEIYRDAKSADWQTKPYDYEIVEQLVDSRTTLQLRLAPGGGQAIRFRPASAADVKNLSPKK